MKLSCVTGLRIKDSLLSDNGGCMLREHLIVKTRPYAYASNVIRWGNYRVTVLGTRLFRMERSENGKFRDCATQAIWYRDMPQQNFSVAWGEHKTVIDTGECRLILHENSCKIKSQSSRRLLILFLHEVNYENYNYARRTGKHSYSMSRSD